MLNTISFLTENSADFKQYQWMPIEELTEINYLTTILLNNLISHTHFWLSANQLTSYNVFIQIHKLNDKHFFQKPSDLDLHCQQGREQQDKD